jgi:formate-dependent nitrite reductase membrane component NrfD
MPQHFVASPQWEWYIVWYFFLGGLAGGAYALGALLRLVGDRRDEGAARVAFLVSFPAMVICPILLTLDLGTPSRFWHMMIDARTMTPTFKYWSPMSVGAWALLVFGLFSTVSFIEALVLDGRLRHPLAQRIAAVVSGGFGRLFMLAGAALGLFIAGYTGVLLAVSNQPTWSDTWALGGLFLASGLSTAAAAIGLFAWYRRDAGASTEKLSAADRYFLVLELVLLAVFFLTLGPVASQTFRGNWIALWVVVLVGTLVPLALHFRSSGGGRLSPAVAAVLVLIGSFALRTVVIFSAQS